MSIGATATDFGTTVIMSLAALVMFTLMLGLGGLIGRRNPKLGLLVALLPLFIALCLGAAVLASINVVGKTVTGTVTQKQETVAVSGAGTWSHYWAVTVNYRADGSTPGTFSNAVNSTMPRADDASAKLDLRKPALYDELRVGDAVKVTFIPLIGGTALVKLSAASISDFVAVELLGWGVALVALIWLALKLANMSSWGCLGSAMLAGIIGIGGPLFSVYQDWRALEDLAGKPLRATATITDVAQVKCIRPYDIVPRNRNTAVSTHQCTRRGTDIEAAQPFDVVEMRFTPPNQRDAVIAVDAVNQGAQRFEKGGTVQIAYNADNPRAAYIIGSNHSHRWRNLIGYVGWIAAGAAVLLGLLAFGLYRSKLLKRKV